MSEKKRALLGLHNPGYIDLVSQALDLLGYQITSTESVEGMYKEMGVNPPDDYSPKNHFDLYVMDTNFGFPDNNSYQPASNVYNCLKKLIQTGETKFLSISGDDNSVRKAREAGIPSVSKNNCIDDIFEMLGDD